MAEQNNPYAEYSSTNLYMDATGKGAVINPPVAVNPVIPQYQKPLAQQGKQQVQDSVDYLASLFDGENLTEDFKLKAATIFEAAINEKVSIIEAQILEAAKEVIEEQTNDQSEKLVEHVDGYLNYVISEWMQENQVAIEHGLRTEIAENFINGLKSLFESSFIDVPQEKYNVLDDLYGANAELQENVNALIRENMELKNEITARLCAETFMEEAQGLADTQVEKLAMLAEGIEFSNVDQYRQKVAILKESYFGQNADQVEQYSTPGMLTEDTGSFVDGGYASVNPVMENVVNAISSITKNKAKPAFKPLNDNPINTRIQAIMSGQGSQDTLF
jgi:hypothetical protein